MLLLAVGVAYSLVGQPQEAALCLAVVVVVLVGEVVVEERAKRALAGLGAKERITRVCSVLRDGDWRSVNTVALACGDLITLGPGDMVPADAVSVSTSAFSCDEAVITGESDPVARGQGTSGHVLLSGSMVCSGSVTACVTATGPRTRIGEIMLRSRKRQEKPKRSPLQGELSALAGVLTVAALVAALAGGLSGLVHGMPWQAMVLAGLSLAFATIPEELPLLVSAVMAVGSRRLASNSILAKTMASLEFLPHVNVVLTDKTGTITEGHLTLADPHPASGDFARLYRVWALTTTASSRSLDRFDRAIALHPDTPSDLPAAPREVDIEVETVFNPTTLLAFRKLKDGRTVVRGAPEAVLSLCDAGGLGGVAEKAAWIRLVADEARRGRRMIALAEDGKLAGVFAFHDPIRPGVRAAVEACKEAGIEVIMVTGDHRECATSVAEAVGIRTVHSRSSPEAKAVLVDAHRESGVVLATGDGVNDAIALASADVGVAVCPASDAARAAASIVLLPGADFSAIAFAIREGRRLYENLVSALVFYLGVKLGLVVGFLASSLVGGFPLLAVHIVVLEMFMDLGTTISFLSAPPASDVMRRPPRRRGARFLSQPEPLIRIAMVSLGIVVATLAPFLYASRAGHPLQRAQSITFGSVMAAHFLLAIQSTAGLSSIVAVLKKRPSLAFVVWGMATAGSTIIILLGPGPLWRLASLVRCSPEDWMVAASAVVASVVTIELIKAIIFLMQWACMSKPRRGGDGRGRGREGVALLVN